MKLISSKFIMFFSRERERDRLLDAVDIDRLRTSGVGGAESSSGNINEDRNSHFFSDPMEAERQEQVKQWPQLFETTIITSIASHCHVLIVMKANN